MLAIVARDFYGLFFVFFCRAPHDSLRTNSYVYNFVLLWKQHFIKTTILYSCADCHLLFMRVWRRRSKKHTDIVRELDQIEEQLKKSGEKTYFDKSRLFVFSLRPYQSFGFMSNKKRYSFYSILVILEFFFQRISLRHSYWYTFHGRSTNYICNMHSIYPMFCGYFNKTFVCFSFSTLLCCISSVSERAWHFRF